MTRPQVAFGALIVAQASHSVEEYVGRLWESFPPARFLTGLDIPRSRAGIRCNQRFAGGFRPLVFALACASRMAIGGVSRMGVGDIGGHQRSRSSDLDFARRSVHTGGCHRSCAVGVSNLPGEAIGTCGTPFISGRLTRRLSGP